MDLQELCKIRGIRGTGRTTEQIRNAPLGAVFVCATDVEYVRDIAEKLGRDDLMLIRKTHPGDSRLKGRNVPIIFDHYITNPD